MPLQGSAMKTNNKSDCHTKKLLQIEAINKMEKPTDSGEDT